MSFIISVYTNEGIIMASDSRTTYTSTTSNPDGLLMYFSRFSPLPATIFVVAGYTQPNLKQQILRVFIKENRIEHVDCSLPGASWDGETDVFSKIVNPVAVKTNDGSYVDLPSFGTGFNFFTLQDAINYAEYAVDVTIKTMFFQDRVKTVGGPIDILAIKPTGGFWIQRKELHA